MKEPTGKPSPISIPISPPANSHPSLQLVNLRIEGATKTIFEGPVLSNGHNITPASGGTPHCDGTNNGVDPTPGNICSSTLDTASLNKRLYSFDGTWTPTFDDYFITPIGGDTQTPTQFW